MIGHLQRNKVKYIVDKAAMIHSVDSLRLAETIEQEGAKRGIQVPILLEVNVARRKQIWTENKRSPSSAEKIAEFPHIQVRGLMTIAPYVEDPEENRVFFPTIKKIKC